MILAPPDFKLCPCPHGQRCSCDMPNIPYESYVPTYQCAIECLRPDTVTEWGPGKNTDIALRHGAQVHSTESEAKYLHEHHPRLVQRFVSVRNPHYAAAQRAAVYFIDGRRRADCLGWTRQLPKKMVVLHDANRRRYWPALGLYTYIIVPDGTTAYATESEPHFELLVQKLEAWAPWKQFASWKEIPVAEQRV